MLDEIGRAAVEFVREGLRDLGDGRRARRFPFSFVRDVPGGMDAILPLLPDWLELWDRPDGLAVSLTPWAMERLGEEFDERWNEFDVEVVREFEVEREQVRQVRHDDGTVEEVRGKRKVIEKRTVTDTEMEEIGAARPSCKIGEIPGVGPCWARPVTQPRELGMFPLEYPELIPAETRELFADSDGGTPGPPPPVETEWGVSVGIGSAVGAPTLAFDDAKTRAYLKAQKRERRERSKAKKAAKRRASA